MRENLELKFNKSWQSAYLDVDGILSRLNESVGEAERAYFAVRFFKNDVPDSLQIVATILKQVFSDEVSIEVENNQNMMTVESSGTISSKHLHELSDEYHSWYVEKFTD